MTLAPLQVEMDDPAPHPQPSGPRGFHPRAHFRPQMGSGDLRDTSEKSTFVCSPFGEQEIIVSLLQTRKLRQRGASFAQGLTANHQQSRIQPGVNLPPSQWPSVSSTALFKGGTNRKSGVRYLWWLVEEGWRKPSDKVQLRSALSQPLACEKKARNLIRWCPRPKFRQQRGVTSSRSVPSSLSALTFLSWQFQKRRTAQKGPSPHHKSLTKKNQQLQNHIPVFPEGPYHHRPSSCLLPRAL